MKLLLLLSMFVVSCASTSPSVAPAPKVEKLQDCKTLVEAFKPDEMQPIAEVGVALVNKLQGQVLTISYAEVVQQIKDVGGSKGYKILAETQCSSNGKTLGALLWDASIDAKRAAK